MKTGDPTTTEAREPIDLEIALDFADRPRRHDTLQAPADSMDELYEALAVLASAYREARSLALREAERVRPQQSETFHYRDSGYTSGWIECETAYRAAIRALRKDES